MNRFPRVMGMRSGYDPADVDTLVGRIEATLGRGGRDLAPVTADDVRAATFRARRGGYNETAVDFALEAFVVALETRAPVPARASRATPRGETRGEPTGETPGETTGEPTGEMLRQEWFETQAARAERVAFRAGRMGAGYDEDAVDAFLDRVVATLRGTTALPVTAGEVRAAKFDTVVFRAGYLIADVDTFLAGIADILDHR
ncbi:DivIVA domain-containing protein [Nonomuraea longicatena]|uniref:Antigen 84 n=1 Tax=Nonomuraea longicatena TaxID=83682 RepID=A0ABP4BM09_9ACTN